MVTKGRFAPTPSGPLHEGSLQTALASWLSARRQGGEWSLRIDDLDGLRCPPGAVDLILRQLEHYGLTWDGKPVYQSERIELYEAARDQLQQLGHLYLCDCTRAATRLRMTTSAASYDQHCRPPSVATSSRPAWRLMLNDTRMQWHDDTLGPMRPTVTSLGDPVVWRRDNIPGYALACAVDEWSMGITEVIRGADLQSETAAQVQISRDLGRMPPRYRHMPIVLDTAGRKMSKQNHADALPTDITSISIVMLRCLQRLGTTPPSMLQGAEPSTLLAWALENKPVH